MVSKAFKRLKRRSGAVELKRLGDSLGFKSGKHKRKRLVMAVGKKVAKRTILDEATHTQHQDKLFKRFRKAWGSLTDQQARERLRFLTILDTVCAVETKAILHAVEKMEERLRSTMAQAIEQIGILGVTEVEIVNLVLYGKEDADDEARKGQVLRQLAQVAGIELTGKEHLALVHFHGIVDLGPNAANTEINLQDALRWKWKGSWCVELKHLFTTLSLQKSLGNLAGYLTKGGNEDLRYQKKFGKESKSIEAMELAMAKQGKAKSGKQDDHLGLSVGEVRKLMKSKRKYIKNGTYNEVAMVELLDGEKGVQEDHLGLSVGEVSVLVTVYDALMRRNSARDGYLFLGGSVVRNRYQSRHGYRIWKSPIGNTPPFTKSTIAIGSTPSGYTFHD